jgi:hypothetical protein
MPNANTATQHTITLVDAYAVKRVRATYMKSEGSRSIPFGWGREGASKIFVVIGICQK